MKIINLDTKDSLNLSKEYLFWIVSLSTVVFFTPLLSCGIAYLFGWPKDRIFGVFDDFSHIMYGFLFVICCIEFFLCKFTFQTIKIYLKLFLSKS